MESQVCVPDKRMKGENPQWEMDNLAEHTQVSLDIKSFSLANSPLLGIILQQLWDRDLFLFCVFSFFVIEILNNLCIYSV